MVIEDKPGVVASHSETEGGVAMGDIIPFSVSGVIDGRSKEKQAVHTKNNKSQKTFAEELLERAVATTRESQARRDAEWDRIRSFILDSSNKLDEHFPTVNPWLIGAELEGFVRSAIDCYIDKAKQFGIDKNGWPKTTCVARKGR